MSNGRGDLWPESDPHVEPRVDDGGIGVIEVVDVPGSTKKICQLTGELDAERTVAEKKEVFTPNRTETKVGLKGTDLGSSFVHDDKVWFFFGDTHFTAAAGPKDNRPKGSDSIASAKTETPKKCARLAFVKDTDDCFLAPRISAVSDEISIGPFAAKRPGMGGGGPYWFKRRPFEVPTGGFSAKGKMYVIFTVHDVFDHKDENKHRWERSLLASATYPEDGFKMHYFISSWDEAPFGGYKFVRVAPWVVKNSEVFGLPETTGKGVLFWGSGEFRKSDVYLAYVPMAKLEKPGKPAWRYFGGLGTSGKPVWKTEESEARPLFSHGCVGQFSVNWNPFLGKWLMLYGCGGDKQPHGINFRVAAKPWGPWSDPQVLFEPWTDGGHSHFIHALKRLAPEASWHVEAPGDLKLGDGYCDGLMKVLYKTGKTQEEIEKDEKKAKEGEKEWGGAYAPFMVADHATGVEAKSTTIYFVLSTWRPYQTVFMKSTLRYAHQDELWGTPALIQKHPGAHGEFVLVAPRLHAGLAYYSRDNSAAKKVWRGPTRLVDQMGRADAIAMVQGNVRQPGNVELVVRTGDRLVFLWRDSLGWHGPEPVAVDGRQVCGVAGNTALVQSRSGIRGNFELVVPLVKGGLAHYWRDNDDPALPWRGPDLFGGSRKYGAVSMVQQSTGKEHLVVVARSGDALMCFWRSAKKWHGQMPVYVRNKKGDPKLVVGVAGSPALVESWVKGKGRFDLVVPLIEGGLAHYRRDNTVPDKMATSHWSAAPVLDAGLGRVNDVAMIQSDLGDPGRLELVLHTDGKLAYFRRDPRSGYKWQKSV